MSPPFWESIYICISSSFWRAEFSVLNSELEFSGIKKIIFYNNYETGWLLQATIETVDGKFFTIGFDKTTGVYAYEGKSEKQLWNIHP